jgi:hypothetical protein
MLEKRRDTTCHGVSSGDRATIYFPGDQVSGPLRVEPSLRVYRGYDGTVYVWRFARPTQ